MQLVYQESSFIKYLILANMCLCYHSIFAHLENINASFNVPFFS